MLYQIYPTVAFKEIQNQKEFRSYWRLSTRNSKDLFGAKMQKLTLEKGNVGLLLSNEVYSITNGSVQFDCFWFLIKDEKFYIPTVKVVPCKKLPTKGSQ